jgi:hypothetical protein
MDGGGDVWLESMRRTSNHSYSSPIEESTQPREADQVGEERLRIAMLRKGFLLFVGIGRVAMDGNGRLAAVAWV